MFPSLWRRLNECLAPGLSACLYSLCPKWGVVSYSRRINWEYSPLPFLSGKEPEYSQPLYLGGKGFSIRQPWATFSKINSLLKVIFRLHLPHSFIVHMIQNLGKEKGWYLLAQHQLYSGYLSRSQDYRFHFPKETVLCTRRKHGKINVVQFVERQYCSWALFLSFVLLSHKGCQGSEEVQMPTWTFNY